MTITELFGQAKRDASGYYPRLNWIIFKYFLLSLVILNIIPAIGAALLPQEVSLPPSADMGVSIGLMIGAYVIFEPVGVRLFNNLIEFQHLDCQFKPDSRMFISGYRDSRLSTIFSVKFIYLIALFFGFSLFIIPGVFVGVLLFFSTLYASRFSGNTYQSLASCAKAAFPHFLKILWVLVALFFINLLAALPLLIGLFWSIPWSLLVLTRLYSDIFEPESEPLESGE